MSHDPCKNRSDGYNDADIRGLGHGKGNVFQKIINADTGNSGDNHDHLFFRTFQLKGHRVDQPQENITGHKAQHQYFQW